MNLIKKAIEARQDKRLAREFIEKYKDYVFVCRVDKNKFANLKEYADRLGGYYVAHAKEVLKNDDEIVEVFHKNDRWTVKVFQYTKDKNVRDELKDIIIYYFGEDYADLIDYTSVQLEGEFFNTCDPRVGLDIKFEKNEVTVKVTFTTQYLTIPDVDEETIKFKKVNKQWVLTECPYDYIPESVVLVEDE